ncbi:MAG TPA: hypothetical protein VL551_21130 [Actinospica sp.]|jgi:hypothetical protein|nr:hypothetical protein [Actinospica sp.]
MSEAIVKALDEAATRVGASLGKDASKAIKDLYRDSSDKLTGVVKRSVESDVEHAGKIKQIADKLEQNAARTDISDAEKATNNDALKNKLHDILNDPGSGTKPTIKREDNDFSQDHFNPIDPKTKQPKIDKATGKPVEVGKSHINANGDLEPANPNGSTTMTQHVIGGNNPAIKGSSPYTSFAPSKGVGGKQYGAHEYQVDYNKLQGDIDSGKVTGVEIHDPASVQGAIQGEIDGIAGQHVVVPHGSLPNGEMTGPEKTDFGKQLAAQYGLKGQAKVDMTARINALSNSRRDNEWLVKGTIPGSYLNKIR